MPCLSQRTVLTLPKRYVPAATSAHELTSSSTSLHGLPVASVSLRMHPSGGALQGGLLSHGILCPRERPCRLVATAQCLWAGALQLS